MDDGTSVGELSRQVRDVLVRFESLAGKLETQFVRTDNFLLYKQLVDQSLRSLDEAVTKLASAEQLRSLSERVDKKAGTDSVNALQVEINELKDDKKWLIRLVATFVILGVLGATFFVAKAGGA
jgi:hypothetical protein